jgi:hypothetical protein
MVHRRSIVIFGALAIWVFLFWTTSSHSVAGPADSEVNDTGSGTSGEQTARSGLDNTPEGGPLPGGTVPGGTWPNRTLPGGAVPSETWSDRTPSGGTVPGGMWPNNTLSGGTVPGGTVPSENLPGEGP